jgi:hypothetical protein
LKCTGKPIPRSARNGLSGQTKALNPKNLERITTKNVKLKGRKGSEERKSLKEV